MRPSPKATGRDAEYVLCEKKRCSTPNVSTSLKYPHSTITSACRHVSHVPE
jgi:hypothetical protein